MNFGTLVAGCAASPEGTALLHNATDHASLEVVLRDPEGRRYAGGKLEKVYVFDTSSPIGRGRAWLAPSPVTGWLMRRDQLEHAIRTACQIIQQPEVIVVGSQAILGTYDESQPP